MDPVTVFKLVSIGCIWIVGLVGGLTPALLASRHDKSPTLSILSAFSGGVFLAGGFFHLLHSAVENPALRRWSTEDEGRYEFPYAEMFCTMGFLGLLLLEQAAQAKMSSSAGEAGTYVAAKSEEDDEELRGATESDDTYLGTWTWTTKNRPWPRVATCAAATRATRTARAMPMRPTPGRWPWPLCCSLRCPSTRCWRDWASAPRRRRRGGLHGHHHAQGAGGLRAGLGPRAERHARDLRHALHVRLLLHEHHRHRRRLDHCGRLVGRLGRGGICVALASGTFIYVAVMEVIPQEFPRHSHGGGDEGHGHQQKDSATLKKSIALVAGYAIFGLLAKWS